MPKSKLTPEEKKEHKKEHSYHWRQNNPNYQKEWRAKNSEKTKDYLCNDRICYAMDKKHPDLPFIRKQKQKKKVNY